MTEPSMYSTSGLLNYAVWLQKDGICQRCNKILDGTVHKHKIKSIPNLRDFLMQKGNPQKRQGEVDGRRIRKVW